MNKIDISYYVDAAKVDDEIPAWKRLDIVCRQWAVLSGFEKDQSDYQRMKEMYQ